MQKECFSDPSFKTTLEILLHLYKTPLEPEAWRSFLLHMAEFFKSKGAHIGITDLRNGKILMDEVVGYDFAPADYETYRKLVTGDPRVTQMLSQPMRPTHCREFMDDDDFRCSEVYRKLLSKLDMEYTLGVALSSDQNYLSFFALMRGKDEWPFRDAERSVLERMVPHIANAVELDHALTECRDLQTAALSVFDRSGLGWIALDDRGCVIQHNELAAEILPDITLGKVPRLQDLNGVPLSKIASEHLRCNDVKTAVFNFMSQDGQTIPTMLVRQSEDVRLVSWIQPAGNRMNILFAPHFSVQNTRNGTAVLRAIYGLSTRESELTLKLVSGDSLREAAQSMGIQENTVRQYIKGAMARLGVKSQVQLVARVSKVVSFDL